jgi:hypothetical protein
MGICLSEEERRVAALPHGHVQLSGARHAFNTGRVLVGARFERSTTGPLAAEAERIQTLLLRPDPRPWWSLSASDPADRLVMRVCFVGAVALALMALAGWMG